MHEMTDAEWRSFAMTGTRTGKVAVRRKDGRPHVTPVWFVLDDTDPDAPHGVTVVFTTGAQGVKGRALRRDPHFALAVDDQEPPYSFLLLECTARISEDLGEMHTWAGELGGRYMGADRAKQFAERNAVPGELLVRGSIDKVTAYAALTA